MDSGALTAGDGLLVADVQNDFLAGGSLAVAQGDDVVPVLNAWIDAAVASGVPVFVTRCWHPPHHCSFREKGGPWPEHCVAGSSGAAFAAELALPSSARIVSKGTRLERDAYSGFQDTDLDDQLRAAGVKRLFIGGLTTDYCVLNTVRDALELGYEAIVLKDAIRAVNVAPGDGTRAEAEMERLGARFVFAS